jgi:hypothetical protein
MKQKPAKPTKPTTNTTNTTNTIGKGFKLCPGCDTKVGARSKTCQCGHEFSPKIEGWDNCKNIMLRMLGQARGGMDLLEIAVARKSKPHDGCLTDKCQLSNKQLQILLAELVKEGKVKKDGNKYKVIK